MKVMQKLMTLNLTLFFLSFFGFCLSLYTLYVEHNLSVNPNSVAMCDISERMSCSKVFSSQYGRGFGFLGRILGDDSLLNQPNSIPGAIFYLLYNLLSLLNSETCAVTLLAMSVTSVFMSAYLAYILVYVLEDICVVCFSIHFINLSLLAASYSKWRLLTTYKLKIKKK